MIVGVAFGRLEVTTGSVADEVVAYFPFTQEGQMDLALHLFGLGSPTAMPCSSSMGCPWEHDVPDSVDVHAFLEDAAIVAVEWSQTKIEA